MEEEEKKKLDNEAKDKVGESEKSGEGDQPKELTLYERTNAATERLEKANAKTEENLKRQEKLYETEKLSGTGGGRVESKPVSEEEKKAEDAAEYFKGTQLEIDIKKANEKV